MIEERDGPRGRKEWRKEGNMDTKPEDEESGSEGDR